MNCRNERGEKKKTTFKFFLYALRFVVKPWALEVVLLEVVLLDVVLLDVVLLDVSGRQVFNSTALYVP